MPTQRRLELTAQEVIDCRSQPELFDFEVRGGVALEVAVAAYAILALHMLIEHRYVPALQLMSSKLRVPPPLIGLTVMAAGNCLPELSISLVSILANGQDIGTGEVLGSCVFDLLAMLGVVCIKVPKDGARMPLPLVLYFIAWVSSPLPNASAQSAAGPGVRAAQRLAPSARARGRW